MAFKWDKSLETGYEKVDKQHKMLAAAVNDLMEASSSGKGDREVLRTLEFLTNYTVQHFTDEENLQIMYEYPDYPNHKRIHEDFREKVGELVRKVNETGPTEEIIAEVSSIICAWLLEHIKGEDFRMASYVKDTDAGLK